MEVEHPSARKLSEIGLQLVDFLLRREEVIILHALPANPPTGILLTCFFFYFFFSFLLGGRSYLDLIILVSFLIFTILPFLIFGKYNLYVHLPFLFFSLLFRYSCIPLRILQYMIVNANLIFVYSLLNLFRFFHFLPFVNLDCSFILATRW